MDNRNVEIQIFAKMKRVWIGKLFFHEIFTEFAESATIRYMNKINNPIFNYPEFEVIENKAEVNRFIV